MNQKSIGITFMILAAVIFGFTPILVRFAFAGGANGITLIFLRATISLPILAAVMKIMKISFELPRVHFKPMLPAALGYSLTGIFLYSAFIHVNVGLAVTIHFINPMLVMLAGALLFREKMGLYKWIALAFVMVGIMLLTGDVDRTNVIGIIFALMSGTSITIYILTMGRSKLRELHFFTITFYLLLAQCFIALGAGIVTGELTFQLTPAAWVYAFMISIFVSIFAVTLFQQGVIKAGASTASLVSCLEPILSIIFGAIFLAEILTPLNILGGVLVISSVALISVVKSEPRR